MARPKIKPMEWRALPKPTVFRVTTGDGEGCKGKAWPTFEGAEQSARRSIKSRGGETYIYGYDTDTSKKACVLMATVLTDALDRVWTQLDADGGRVVDDIERMLS